MKKLMTMIAAVATAFGLYAAAPSITDNAVNFSEFTGQPINPWTLTDKDGQADALWTWSDTTPAENEAKVENNKLVLATGAKVLARKFATDPVSVDDDNGLFANVKIDFQNQGIDADSIPTATDLVNAKLALFLLDTSDVAGVADSAKGTNLFAIAGYGTTRALYKLSAVVNDAFLAQEHTFTIKFYNKALSASNRAGFMIYMDGENASAGEGVSLQAKYRYDLEGDAFDLTDETSCMSGNYLGDLTVNPSLTKWYNEQRLLVSLMEDNDQTFAGVEFKGKAAIASIKLTDDKSQFEFIPGDSKAIGVNDAGLATALTASNFSFDPANGASYANGAITVFDDATQITVTPTFTLDYREITIGSKKGTDSLTFTINDGTTLTVREAAAAAYVDCVAYETFQEALSAAAGKTLKLNKNLTTADFVGTSAYLEIGTGMTLDLAGKTITAAGTDEDDHGVIFVSGGVLTITNSTTVVGEVIATEANGVAINNDYTSGAEVKICGGKFNGLVQNLTEERSAYEGIVATAGSFTVDPTYTFLAAGKVATYDGEYYVVGDAPVYVVKIEGGDQYTSFAEAFSNVTDGATIKFLDNFEGPFRDGGDDALKSNFVNGVTIDLNGKTWTMTGDGEKNERLWEDRCGNSFLIKNGSLKAVPATEGAKAPQSVAFYTYAETLEFNNVALDFSELKVEETADPADPRASVPIVSQNGNVKFTGTTTVTLATNQRLVTIQDRANAAYEPGTLTLDVNGTLPGDILLYSACKIAVGAGTTLSGKVYTGAAANSGFEPAGALGSPFKALVGKIVPKTGSTSSNTRGGQLYTSIEDAQAAIATTAFEKNVIVLQDATKDSFAVVSGTVNFEIPADVMFTATTSFTLNGAKVKLDEGGTLVVPAALDKSADFVAPAEGKEIKVAGEGPYTYTVGDAATPVPPEEPIVVPAVEAEAKVAEMNDNKAKMLVPPAGVTLGTEELANYQDLFVAVFKISGENANCEYVLNSDGTNEVKEAEAVADKAALDAVLAATGDSAELSVAAPLKGFYYSLKQGAALQSIDFNEGDVNKLGGVNAIKFALEKDPAAGFYQMIVTPHALPVEKE